jgi:hypothetical protein
MKIKKVNNKLWTDESIEELESRLVMNCDVTPLICGCGGSGCTCLLFVCDCKGNFFPCISGIAGCGP